MEHQKIPLWSLRSYRLLVVFLLMFSFFCSTSMRIDLGIAIVCMVDPSIFLQNALIAIRGNKSKESLCQNIDAVELLSGDQYQGTMKWTARQQSILFSANHYGAFMSVVPAGILADKFNPKLSLLLAICDMAFFTLLTPLLAAWSFYAFFTARFLMGIGEGFIMPTMASMSARWFPPVERSTAIALYTSGNQLASSSVYWMGAALCSVEFFGGWPLIFYSIGLLALSWMVLWSLYVTNSPGQNKWISDAERAYLNKCLKNPQQKLTHAPIPWKSIMTSMPVIANLITMYSITFTITTLQSFLPTYFRDVLFINLKKNGLYTTMPFFAQLVAKNLLGILSDQLKKRKLLKPTAACKIFQVTGNLLQATSLLLLAFLVDCNKPTLAVALLLIQGAGAATAVPGTLTSCISIAPSHSGTMISLAMLSGQFGSTISPNFVALLRKQGTPDEWTKIFTSIACVLMFSALFFSIFGSAEQQNWASDKLIKTHNQQVASKPSAVGAEQK